MHESNESLPPGLDLEAYMREALAEADRAGAAGELPVGAVVVLDGAIIARGHPRRIRYHNPVAHAETEALARGGERLWAAPDRAVLFTTLEPCPMCLGATVVAGIAHIIFAMPDVAVYSGDTVRLNPYVRHHIKTYRGGILADASRAIMQRHAPTMFAKLSKPSLRPWYRAENESGGEAQ